MAKPRRAVGFVSPSAGASQASASAPLAKTLGDADNPRMERVLEPAQIGALSAQFERDGFVNAGPLLSHDQVATLRDEVERFADVQFRGKPPSGPMPLFDVMGHGDGSATHFKMDNVWLCSEPFRDLVTHPILMQLAAAFGKTETLRWWGDTVQYKPAAEGGPVNWHQDGYFHRLLGGIVESHRIVGAWIALDDADEESGCMWMAPGSHRWDLRPNHMQRWRHLATRSEIGTIPPFPKLDEAEWRKPVPCPVKAGEVHFHHAHTWHASPTNESARVRRAYTVFYLGDGVDLSNIAERALIYDRKPVQA